MSIFVISCIAKDGSGKSSGAIESVMMCRDKRDVRSRIKKVGESQHMAFAD